MPLVGLLRAVLGHGGAAGAGVDNDDLAAALGRPLLCGALPGEARLSCWAAAWHDAFLADAARLFGLSLRAIQPPDAARGLEQATGYAQHFEASYLPFVRAALAHGQPVVAWSGLSRGDAEEPGWVLVTHTGKSGAELAGLGLVEGDPRRAGAIQPLTPREVVFEQPPVQLYIVEECKPAVPAPSEVLALAIEHVRLSVSGALDECFGLVTGVAAYDHWIERIQRDSGGPAAQLAAGHARLAALVVEGARSGERFFGRHADVAPVGQRDVARSLRAVCREIADALAPGLDATSLAPRLRDRAGVAELVEQLATARTALARAVGVLRADSEA